MPAPRVDFYVLASQDPASRLRFACRLVEKAWRKRHRVRVQFDAGGGELEAFDDLLWTWADRSFVPHHRLGTDEQVPGAPAPVVIADSDDSDAGDGDLIVNLAQALPPRLDCFQRIAEVVDADDSRRRRGRERFRQYRERGIEPETHDMKDEP